MLDHMLGQEILAQPEVALSPIQICLLGAFRLLRAGQPVAVRCGSKLEALLSFLSLRFDQCVPRDRLLQSLWPESDVALASQSLRSLLHRLQQLLGDALGGAPLIIHRDGCYQLNPAVGVEIDIVRFDVLVQAGDAQRLAGDNATATACYAQAIALYHGDLHLGPGDLETLLAREQRRSRFLVLLTQLANEQFTQQNYAASVELAQRLLAVDPCCEATHRLLMRCYVRLGHRSHALHQYHVCVDILHRTYATAPEPATTMLFDQIRLEPRHV